MCIIFLEKVAVNEIQFHVHLSILEFVELCTYFLN